MDQITPLTHRDASLATRLAALSHPVRIDILRHVSALGSCCCKDVVARLDLAQSTVSQHLKVLVDAGLVRYTPQAQRSLYQVDRDGLADLVEGMNGVLKACCDDSGCTGGKGTA
jgi:ArsR family transcriptional regulator